ncbi:MAG: hypothetical protein OEU25_12865 [Rhodospirillales bacterium]|nr:hypothetical protein [Rhodospirillales bacterium]
MKRGYGGGRSYDSSSDMSYGNGLKSGKGGLKVPPMQTDTKSMGADPQKSWKGCGANVKGSRLPSDGKPRR